MLLMGFLILLAEISMAAPTSEKGSACGPPPNVQNGIPRTAIKETYSKGELVYYKCLPGYTMRQQANYVTCKDSHWTEPPICRRINQICGPPPTVLHGEIKGKKLSNPSGSSVTYECAHLYTLEGNERITCQDGEWDKEPICREPCRISEATMQNNKIQQKFKEGEDKNEKYQKHSHDVTFECQPGYQISDVSRLTVQCLDGEIEYPKCLKPGQCDLPNILHGKMTPYKEDGYDSGSSVDVECPEPYALNGNRHLICENGQWSHLPQCLQSCTIHSRNLEEKNIVLESPDDLTKVHKHGKEIKIKCKLRFESPQTLRAFCDDGIMKYTRCFPENLGICRLNQETIDDNFLELHEDHHNELFYGDGEIVQFKCKAGFTARRGLTGRCGKPENPDSVSNEPVLIYPKCERVCHINQQAMDANFLKLTGAQEELYAESEVVLFQCKDGYATRRDLTGICHKVSDESDEMAFTYPTCRRIGESCGFPPIVSYGDLIGYKRNIYASGSSVVYRCSNFYTLQGNDRITCMDGEWDKEPVCRAPCTVTEKALQQHNIQYKYKNNGKLYMSHLDYVSFVCLPQYVIPDTRQMRAQCVDGVINYPQCTRG